MCCFRQSKAVPEGSWMGEKNKWTENSYIANLCTCEISSSECLYLFYVGRTQAIDNKNNHKKRLTEVSVSIQSSASLKLRISVLKPPS